MFSLRTLSRFWSHTAYRVVVGCVGAFLALTTLGMFLYPGGTNADKTTAGYSFFTNFFSDLGRTIAHNGQPNSLVSPLFTLAMTLAGVGLALFFLAFRQFFAERRSQNIIASLGTVAGVFAGVCFIGVGFTPSNVQPRPHGLFVLSAFITFFIAVLHYIVAILRSRRYPRQAAIGFIAFAVLLGLYIALQFLGPRGRTFEATLVQAAGQKVIVYASIASVLVQCVVTQRAAQPLPR